MPHHENIPHPLFSARNAIEKIRKRSGGKNIIIQNDREKIEVEGWESKGYERKKVWGVGE
jgi:hypothetical protein